MMKKITLLLVLMLPVLAFCQTWEFNSTTDGWEGAQGTFTANTTTATLSFDADKSPKIRREAGMPAGIDAGATAILSVNIRNNSGAGIVKVKYDRLATSGNRFVNFEITPNKNSFKTYYFDLSDAEWDNNGAGGTQDNIEIIFKSPDDMNIVDAGEIEFEIIEFLSEIPITPRLDYQFTDANDAEGWVAQGGTNLTVDNDILTLNFDGSNNPRIAQTLHSVNATNNKYVHITLKNNSATDDQGRVSFPKTGGGRNFVNFSISSSDPDFVTYDVDLTNNDWTGSIEDIDIRFRNSGSNNSDGTGSVEIESIVFDNNEVLSTSQPTGTLFTMYPNPTTDNLNFRSKTQISQVIVYNITGKTVLEFNNLNKNRVDVSMLNTGLYLVKIIDVNNSVATQRLLKR